MCNKNEREFQMQDLLTCFTNSTFLWIPIELENCRRPSKRPMGKRGPTWSLISAPEVCAQLRDQLYQDLHRNITIKSEFIEHVTLL